MILVAGGTGTLGTMVVRRLSAAGAAVRVLTRDPSRAAHLRADPVDVAAGDLRDKASLRAAMRGVETVVAAAHGFGADDSVSPASVDGIGNVNLIDAAASAGAAVVLISGVLASPESPLELFRAKHAAERHLIDSGVSWTIVRPTAFVETWAQIMGTSLRKDGRTLVFGRGENPINFVSASDVAALTERVVGDSSFRSETIEIGGSRNITFLEFAALVGVALGKPANPRHIPRPALRALGLLAQPFKPSFARHARAAVVMDTDDMTWDDAGFRQRFPEATSTSVPAAIEEYFRSRSLMSK